MFLRLAAALLVAAGSAPAAFRAGAGRADITPRTFPIIIAGGFLAATAERAAGTLQARAVALEDGERRIVISVVDTLMMPRELVDRIKETAAKSTGIPPERMLISATHTHSAPPVMGALGTDFNPEYARQLEAGVVQAIEGAVKNLEPARAGWTSVDASGYTHCRRWILRPDRMRKDPFGELTVRAHMHPGYQNPEFVGPSGPVDPMLSIVSLQSAGGRPLAMLANFSMHYVGAGGRVVSPDYYGPFVEKLAALAGGDGRFVAMMSQGTSGDQHWMDYSQPKKDVTAAGYGEALAEVAARAARSIEYSGAVGVAMAEARLRLKRRTPDPERLAWARALVAQMGGAPPKNQQEVYAREQVYLAAEPERELKLQAVRIGEAAIAAIPNEVFAITGLKIKKQSPLASTFNIELANGADGYIPPPEQHRLGGYTTWPARTAGLEENAEPRIVETVLELLEQVSGRKRRPAAEPPGAYTKAVLAAGPLAYWRLNEFRGTDAADEKRRSKAVYEGRVAYYLDGAVDRAPHFAGGLLRAQVAGLGGRHSVEFWFYNSLADDARPVTGRLVSSGGAGLSLAGGKLLLTAGEARAEGATAVGLRTWNHVVLVRDGASLRVFLNGREEVSGRAGSAGKPGEFLFAAAPDDSSTLEGRLDEIAVYSRALSGKEAGDHYRARAR